MEIQNQKLDAIKARSDLLLTLAVDKGFESSIEEGCDVYYSRRILSYVKLVIVAAVNKKNATLTTTNTAGAGVILLT